MSKMYRKIEGIPLPEVTEEEMRQALGKDYKSKPFAAKGHDWRCFSCEASGNSKIKRLTCPQCGDVLDNQ